MTRVADLLAGGRTYSFEFFPPKTDAAQLSLGRTIAELEPLAPSFVSVTYGAGGSTRERTREVVKWVAKETAITSMAHLTCQSHVRADINSILDDYRSAGIENILALGGDPPADGAEVPASDYRFASELLEEIDPSVFSVGVAAHPEIHPRSADRESDRRQLAAKLRRADFAISQFFFPVRALLPPGRRAGHARRRQAGDPRHHADHQHRPGAQDGGHERDGDPGMARRPSRRCRRPDRGPTHRRRRRHDAVHRTARRRRPGPALLHAQPQYGQPRDLRQPRPSHALGMVG